MKSILASLLAGWLLLLPTTGEGAEADCGALLKRFQFGGEPVLLLTAVGTLYPESKPVVDAALGIDWWLSNPVNLTEQATSDSVRAGVDHICAWLQSLSVQERRERAREIGEWNAGYRTVEVMLSLLGVEGLGSAVARCPATRAMFPRSDEDIAVAGTRIGESLAAGENVGLWYALATYLGTKPSAERAEVVVDLMRLGCEYNDSFR